MALFGNITLLGCPAPTGMAFSIGLDGKKYLVQQSTDGSTTEVGCANTNTVFWSLDTTTWRANLGTLGIGVTGTFYPTQVWVNPGSDFFYVVGFSYWYDNSLGRSVTVGVGYSIVNDTTVVQSGPGICYSCSGTSLDRVVNGTDFYWSTWSGGGSDLFAITWVGQNIFSDGHAVVCKVPLAGGVDLSSGAWEARCCELPFGLQPYIPFPAGSRFYTNKSTMITDPSGVGIYLYGTPVDNMTGYNPSKMNYCVLDPGTMTIPGGIVDRSADFGIPFADEGLNFVGGAGSVNDYYTAPSLTGVTGPTGYNHLIMGRTYSDQQQVMGFREFEQNLVTGVITPLGGLIQFTYTADVFPTSMPQTQFQRVNSTSIDVVGDDQTIFHFGTYVSVPADVDVDLVGVEAAGEVGLLGDISESVDLTGVEAAGEAGAFAIELTPPPGPPILPAYPYVQYNDDDDIQAFFGAYNEYAQSFSDWFQALHLPDYTSYPISGALLDWVAKGLYGMARPSISYFAGEFIGPLATYGCAVLGMAVEQNIGTETQQIVNDDVFRRILTWHIQKSMGKVFDVRWLKRRIIQFLKGINGVVFNVDQTYEVSITFGPGNQVNINFQSGTWSNITGAFPGLAGCATDLYAGMTATFTSNAAIDGSLLKAAIQSGALELPFQFTYVVNL